MIWEFIKDNLEWIGPACIALAVTIGRFWKNIKAKITSKAIKDQFQKFDYDILKKGIDMNKTNNNNTETKINQLSNEFREVKYNVKNHENTLTQIGVELNVIGELKKNVNILVINIADMQNKHQENYGSIITIFKEIQARNTEQDTAIAAIKEFIDLYKQGLITINTT